MSPTFDKTFCSGLRCTRANTCARWTVTLEERAKAGGIDLADYKISVANFADHAGNCSHYIPLKEASEAEA